MQKRTYESVVAELIAKLKAEYKITDELSDKTDVMELGIDSLDMVNYIFFLEETYGVTIEDEEIQNGGLLVISNTVEYILSTKPD